MKIVTFGCRINTYESNLIRSFLKTREDVIVVNTCAVTAEAERQCRQTIRKLARENPTSKLIVTGCAVQLHPDVYAKMPEVSFVLGNREKLDPAFFETKEKVCVRAIDETPFEIPLVRELEGSVRAFLQIQQGCDHQCTFCIVRAVRGKSQSLSPEQVLQEAVFLSEKGFSEIVLTGIDLTSYAYGLAELIRKILKQAPGIKRIRLGSLDPAGVDDDLIRLFAKEERLMPHAHFSVQAGDNLILKRMGRRHTREQVMALCARLKEVRPDMVFGADLIAGFPTETQEAFQNTLDLVQKTGLILLHVFPFSSRPGTPSAKMPMVPVSVRKKRAMELRALGKKQLHTYLCQQVGKKETVLVEEKGTGLNAHYIRTYVPEEIPVGSLVQIINKGVKEDALLGTP